MQPERTAHGYRRFRCRACGRQFNEPTGTVLNRAQYPSDVVALVVLWRLRYKLSLRDLPEMVALRGMVSCDEAVREWEAKLTPAMAEELWRRRRGKVSRSWSRRHNLHCLAREPTEPDIGAARVLGLVAPDTHVVRGQNPFQLRDGDASSSLACWLGIGG